MLSQTAEQRVRSITLFALEPFDSVFNDHFGVIGFGHLFRIQDLICFFFGSVGPLVSLAIGQSGKTPITIDAFHGKSFLMLSQMLGQNSARRDLHIVAHLAVIR